MKSGCLWLYPETEWQKVRDQVNALPSAKKVHRNLQLKLVGAATSLEPDGNGRVLLPASHRNAAGIERTRVLLGMGGSWNCGASRRIWRRSDRPSVEDDDQR